MNRKKYRKKLELDSAELFCNKKGSAFIDDRRVGTWIIINQ